MNPWSLWSLCLLSLPMFGCGGTQHAEFAGNEIDLTRTNSEVAEPTPAPTPRYCPKGDAGCSVQAEASTQADPVPLDPARRYQVALSPRDPIRGPAGAPVTLVVFSDFQCPYCKQLALTLAELQMRYSQELRLVWKDLPLPHHAFALPAALLARSAYARAGSRGFWDLHDAIFVQQEQLNEQALERIAQRFDLNWPPDTQYQGHIDDTFDQVLELNVRFTPTVFINGRPIEGAKPPDAYVDVIESELADIGADVSSRRLQPQSSNATTPPTPWAQRQR